MLRQHTHTHIQLCLTYLFSFGLHGLDRAIHTP